MPASEYYSFDLYNGLGVGEAESAGGGGHAIGGRVRPGGRQSRGEAAEGTPCHCSFGARVERIASVPAETFI